MLAGFLLGTRPRAARRPRAGLRGHADAARRRARRPAPPRDRRSSRWRSAALLSLGVLWLAALGVRERHALELAPGPAPRLSLARFGLDAVLLGGGSLLGFAALETWIHARAGMHMHWWQCLEGPCTATRCRSCSRSRSPPRRCSRALRHALAWARRVVHVLRAAAAAARRATGRSRSPLRRIAAPAWLLARALRARGPPALSIP